VVMQAAVALVPIEGVGGKTNGDSEGGGEGVGNAEGCGLGGGGAPGGDGSNGAGGGGGDGSGDGGGEGGEDCGGLGGGGAFGGGGSNGAGGGGGDGSGDGGGGTGPRAINSTGWTSGGESTVTPRASVSASTPASESEALAEEASASLDITMVASTTIVESVRRRRRDVPARKARVMSAALTLVAPSSVEVTYAARALVKASPSKVLALPPMTNLLCTTALS